MRKVFALLVLGLLLGGRAIAGAELPTAFASREQGRGVLSQRDDFVTRLSPFDRAARLKKDTVVAEAEYLEFVRASVLDWSADEKRRVAAALETVAERFRRSALAFPSGVLLIRTNGNEEGNAAYTRGNAIVLPTSVLADARAICPTCSATNCSTSYRGATRACATASTSRSVSSTVRNSSFRPHSRRAGSRTPMHRATIIGSRSAMRAGRSGQFRSCTPEAIATTKSAAANSSTTCSFASRSISRPQTQLRMATRHWSN